MALEFKIKDVAFNEAKYSFLKIGAQAKSESILFSHFKFAKKEKISGLWGTLGWADDRPFTAKGNIQFSENGNESHRGVTKELTQIIMDQNPDVKSTSEIRERFINLSEVQFQSLPKTIKKEEEIYLRFDLFLEKHEGALVYLQDNPKGVMNSKHSLVNLVTPEATPNHTQDRIKLTYLFPYSFGKELEYDEVNKEVVLTDQPKVMPTVLKVLTFVRKPLQPKEFMKLAAKQMNNVATDIVHAGLSVLGNKKYKLYLFDKKSTAANPGGQFKEIANASILKKEAKTLLLLHGTFSSVDGSYGQLCETSRTENGKAISPLQKLVNEGVFEQVIGFNHPTASQSVDENVAALYNELAGFKFTKPLDVITTSRGALVGETLLSNPKSNDFFTIGRMMTFAPAHGSDLLKVAKGLDRFLSFLKGKTSSLGWGYVIALAQFSIKAIATQPGLNDMLPNSPKVTEVINSIPNNAVSIQAMIGDFDKTLIGKRAIRILSVGMDALIRLAFKSETDWVIGCPEQRKRIKNQLAKYESDFEMFCIHGMQFKIGHPKKDKKEVDMTIQVENFFK